MIRQLKITLLTACILVCIAAAFVLVIKLPIVFAGAGAVGLVYLCYKQAQMEIDR